MREQDLTLKPFAPRDTTRRGSGWFSRFVAVLLVLGVIATVGYWSGALVRAEAAAVNPWRSDPPTVSLGTAERDAIAALKDHPEALTVLTYHEVSRRAGTDAGGAYTVSPENFSLQLAALKEAGYTSVTLREVADFVAGKTTLPPRAVLITFDDGHASDLGVADAILAQYGYTAVAFLITGSLATGPSRSYYLNGAEVQTMRASGRWEFGSHTHALHFRQGDAAGRQLTALDHRLRGEDGTVETFEQWRTRVDRDLTTATEDLRARLGQPTFAFAYPFGAYGQDDSEMGAGDPKVRAELRALMAKHGFTLGFAGMGSDVGSAVYAGDDPLTLRRLSVRAGMSPAQLLYVVDELQPTPIRDAVGVTWKGSGANCETDATAGTLTVAASSAATASCRPQANSDLWKDYTVSATVSAFDPRARLSMTLRDGRAWPKDDRVELQLSSGAVDVVEFVGGAPRRIGRWTNPDIGRTPIPVRATVRGTTMTVRIGTDDVTVAPLTAAGAGGVSVGLADLAEGKMVWRDLKITE